MKNLSEYTTARALPVDRSFMSRFAAAMGIALLAACAASPWQKAGAERSAIDNDVRECQQRANIDARKLAQSGINDKPAIGVTPRGQAGILRLPQGVNAIDPVAEDDLFRACMRERGYTREPPR